jgi:hypothetical protein
MCGRAFEALESCKEQELKNVRVGVGECWSPYDILKRNHFHGLALFHLCKVQEAQTVMNEGLILFDSVHHRPVKVESTSLLSNCWNSRDSNDQSLRDDLYAIQRAEKHWVEGSKSLRIGNHSRARDMFTAALRSFPTADGFNAMVYWNRAVIILIICF